MALSWTLDKLGPMARSAEDCEAILRALSGKDPEDDWTADEPPPSVLPVEALKGLRVAHIPFDFTKAGDKEIGTVVDAALADLRKSGVAISEEKLPDLPFEDVAGVILACEAATAFESLFKDGRVRLLTDRGAPLAQALGRPITGADYVKASRIRTLCQKAMADFFSKWDVILAPGEPVEAYGAHVSYEEADKLQWPDPVGGMGNLCGLPAASVPCGFTSDGLPVGLAIVGGAFEEAKVLAFAKHFQGLSSWHRKRPSLA
jgi:aspartyl-tRNA(Asn)/glutamyl-tRNA(Gln) amidotransferase subunit A